MKFMSSNFLVVSVFLLVFPFLLKTTLVLKK